MNSPAQELLNDLIHDRDSAFDEQLLAGTLAAVRRRRTGRRVGNAVTVLAAAVVLMFGWIQLRPVAPSPVATVSRPVVPEYLVFTRPLSSPERVVSTPGMFTVVTSESDPSLVVNTVPSPDLYQLISDVELKMLMARHNPVLLRQPNQRPQLLLDGKPFGTPPNVN